MNILDSLVEFLGFSGVTGTAQLVVTIIAFVALYQFCPSALTRKQARLAGIIWVLLVTAEYWIAGPYSFVFEGTDTIMSIPFYIFINQAHDGGLYSHAFNGGMDIAASTAFSGQYISFERTLLDIAPIWVANMVQKILSVGLAFWGMYLVARRFGGSERVLALGLAALYPLSQHYMTHHSWFHGLGYALIPMAAYLCVFRFGKKHYLTGTILVSALYAISSSQPLGGMAFFVSLVLAVALTNKHKLSRLAVAIGIPGLFVLTNWAESLYAKALIGPLTFRGFEYSHAVESAGAMVKLLSDNLLFSVEVSVITAAALLLLVTRQPGRFIFLLLVCVLATWSGALLNQMPWQEIGLPPLAGVNFGYITFSITFIGLLVASMAGGVLRITPLSRTLAIVALSLALGKFAWYKAVNLPVWLSDGGLPVLSENIKRFQNPVWAPKQPFRVVSMPYRLSPNMAPAVGLDALDATSNLILRSTAYFWTRGVLDISPRLVNGGFMLIRPPGLDFKCCDSYNVTDFINLDFLRIANVGYILSTLPLYGGGLLQVAGPADSSAPPRNTLPRMQRITAYAGALIEPSPVYVYGVGEQLPRVYGARGVVVSPQTGDDDDYLALIGKHALSGKAVVRTEENITPFKFSKTLRVEDFRLVRDGFDITVHAPDGGSILVNAPF
ncbi:MAG: hypothetical protein HQ513_08065, partial [Rhodospirillales bacterium]|nr:hypothetical protein [Rhodospirillales bacterium]